MFIGAACSGDGDGNEKQTLEERALALFDEDGVVEGGVVVKAYEEGHLGTREEVEADMDPYFNPPDRDPPLNIPKPFDARGDIIPLGDMTNDQAYAFGRWYGSSDKVNDIIGPDMQTAVLKAQKERDREAD